MTQTQILPLHPFNGLFSRTTWVIIIIVIIINRFVQHRKVVTSEALVSER